MNRTMALILTCLGLVAAAAAQTAQDVQKLVDEFTGEAPLAKRSATDLEKAYGQVLDALIPGMGAESIEERELPQQTLERMCHRASRPEGAFERAALCGALAARLGPATAHAARVWMLRKIEPLGREESVAALTLILSEEDQEIRDLGRRALQNNPSEPAAAALRAALDSTDNAEGRVALVNALAFRRDEASSERLVLLANDADDTVSAAAVAALGAIGGAAEIEALTNIYQQAESPRRDNAVDALLHAAERLYGGTTGIPDAGLSPRSEAYINNYATAARVYQMLWDTSDQPQIRRAALVGLAASRADDATRDLLLATLARDDDAKLQQTAARALQRMQPGYAMAGVRQTLSGASPATAAVLIETLGVWGGEESRALVVGYLGSESAELRLAAIRAMQRLAVEADLPALLKLARSEDKPESAAARECLGRAAGPKLDEALIALSKSNEAAIRCESVRALAARKTPDALNMVYFDRAKHDSDPEVQRAALAALAEFAEASQARDLVHLLLGATDDETRAAAEEALVRASLRLPDAEVRSAPVLETMAKASATQRATLIRALGRLQGSASLAAVRRSVTDGDPHVRDAAIRALARWETAEPLEDLLELARHRDDATQQALALRAYIRLLRLPSQRDADDSLARVGEAMKLAASDEDRKQVLAALGDVSHRGALSLAQEAMGDPAVRNEAAVAVVNIAKRLASEDGPAALAALERVRGAEVAEAARKAADEAVELLKSFEGYIGTWRVSGPYTGDDLNFEKLMDHAFAPEQEGGSSAKWSTLISARSDNPWIFDLSAVGRGSNRCAYVRTRVWSGSATPARLELGSDDGVVVWLNGARVHRKASSRPVHPGDDKVEVELREGWNDLMLKIVQGSGDWGFTCGVRAGDGSPLAGLRFEPE